MSGAGLSLRRHEMQAVLKPALMSLIATTSLSAPSGSLEMVRHLLSSLPDVNLTGQYAAADVELWIAPDGTITECNIARSIGDQEVLRLICPALLGFRTESPSASDGEPVHADVSLPITVFPDRRASLKRQLDDNLEALRKESNEPRYVEVEDIRWRNGWRVLVEVREDGAAATCERANDDVGRRSGETVCSAAIDQMYPTRLDANGVPTRYIMAVEALD